MDIENYNSVTLFSRRRLKGQWRKWKRGLSPSPHKSPLLLERPLPSPHRHCCWKGLSSSAHWSCCWQPPKTLQAGLQANTYWTRRTVIVRYNWHIIDGMACWVHKDMLSTLIEVFSSCVRPGQPYNLLLVCLGLRHSQTMRGMYFGLVLIKSFGKLIISSVTPPVTHGRNCPCFWNLKRVRISCE